MNSLKFQEDTPPRVQIVSVDKVGHINQCTALCALLGWQVESVTRIPGAARGDSLKTAIVVNWRRFWAVRGAKSRKRNLTFPVIVASGASSEEVVAAYRQLYGDGLFCIFVGSPKSTSQTFDLAIASKHSETLQLKNYAGALETVWISGVLVRPVVHEGIEQTQAVLIGGKNKAFDLDPDHITSQLDAVTDSGESSGLATIVVFSRRTEAKLERIIRHKFADRATFIDRADREGFLQVLRTAQRFFVTPDSITMLCEARSTGRPVALVKLPCHNAETSTARFVDAAIRQGFVTWISGINGDACPPSDGISEAVNRAGSLYRDALTRRAKQK